MRYEVIMLVVYWYACDLIRSDGPSIHDSSMHVFRYAARIPESAAVGLAVLRVGANDVDTTDQTISFRITAGNRCAFLPPLH